MQHGFSEQEWMSFIDGEAATPERRRIEEHLSKCADCSATAGQLRSWRVLLRAEGQRLSEALEADEFPIEAMAERALARLRGAGAGVGDSWSVGDGLTLLRFVMEPLCGTGATQMAMNLAIRRSAGTAKDLTGNNWGLFVGNLRETTTLVCGLAAGRLVSRAGSCLSIAA